MEAQDPEKGGGFGMVLWEAFGLGSNREWVAGGAERRPPPHPPSERLTLDLDLISYPIRDTVGPLDQPSPRAPAFGILSLQIVDDSDPSPLPVSSRPLLNWTRKRLEKGRLEDHPPPPPNFSTPPP